VTLQLEGKVALIMGGSSGIGEAISRRFGREGASVAVVSSRSVEKAEVVAAAIRSSGGKGQAYVADVREMSSLGALATDVVRDFCGIDILVNSAGVYFPTRLGETRLEDIHRMVDVNLIGTMLAIEAIVPYLTARGGGRIINLSSVAAYIGSKDYPLYCATKAAVKMLTRAMALQLAPLGININAIAPGNTATPMNEHIRTQPEFAQRRALIEATTPSQRKFSDPDDMASAALFLASAQGRAMHGATMLIDEGRAAGW
jgi:NAD(P)-dependent dehydrogenase (short-subunit alcohol dehydrogenase family)